MSKAKVEKSEDKPFRVGRRKYQKLGEVKVGGSSSGKTGDDFVKLSDVKSLIPSGIKHDEIHIVGNREGIQVYRRLS